MKAERNYDKAKIVYSEYFEEWHGRKLTEADYELISYYPEGVILAFEWLLDKLEIEKQSAQAEAWDEGFTSGSDHATIVGYEIERGGDIPEKPTNPYKQ